MTSVALPSSSGTTREKRSYADLAETAWIWSIVGYSVLRFFVAWGAFSEHGANIWVFGIIDVGTAWPYGKSVALVTRRAANGEWSKLPAPLAVAIATFFAPYAYLWFAAGEMPPGVRFGMVLCVSVLLLAATAGVLTKARKLRRTNAAAEADAGEEVVDTTGGATVLASVDTSQSDVVDLRASTGVDLVIDLTGDDVELHRTTNS